MVPPGTAIFARGERALHVDRGEPGGLKPHRIEPQIHLPLAAAEDRHLTDAVDALDLPPHFFIGKLRHVTQ